MPLVMPDGQASAAAAVSAVLKESSTCDSRFQQCQYSSIGSTWLGAILTCCRRPAKTGARGRPQEYSDVAIETAMFIRQVFHLPLRQTEDIMKATIAIPNFRSISKRSIKLPKHVVSKAMEPGSLVIVDSTGLSRWADSLCLCGPKMAFFEPRRSFSLKPVNNVKVPMST